MLVTMRTMIKIVFLSVPLAVATAQTAADPRVDHVDRVISLAKSLVKGVDQCFNPSHTKGNAEVKNRLNKLHMTAVSAKSGLISGDALKLTQATAELQMQWRALSEKAPLAARVHCKTQLKCMELGFEGHAKYPHCQPVDGNNHANIQYIQFQQLMRAIPRLITDLQ